MVLVRSKGAVPLYQQLETYFRQRIEAGDYKKGDILPSEKELMTEYGISRITARQALGNLANSGYVEGRPGVGTVVTFEKINEKLKRVISFSEEMAQHGITMSTSFCEAVMEIPDKAIAEELGSPIGTLCLCISRVRQANGIPVVYSMTWISPAWNLPADPSCYMDSLYSYLREKHGIVVSSAVDTLEATLADNEMAGYLSITAGEPVFKRSRKSFDPDGRVIEFTVCYYPGKSYKYSVEL